jgi:peptidoglycan-associated lipoprotein
MSPIHCAPILTSPIVRSRLVAVLSALLTLVLASGCASRTPAPELDAPPEEPVAVSEASGVERVAVRKPSVTLEPVYFDTDEAMLRTDARGSLESYARSILDHPEWGAITIDGHCDERGSDQYNLALGRRRAATVEHYLLQMGVPRTRIAIRSFGAGRPAVAGHDESAWNYNRRTEFQVEMSAATQPVDTGNLLARE